MTNTKVASIALALAAAFCSSATLAATADMTVTAKVTGTCQMVAAPTVDFGDLNQVTAADLTTTAVNIQYKCTKGTPVGTFSVGGSTNGTYDTGVLSNGTDDIPFTLKWDSSAIPDGAGMGTGSEVSVPIHGEMAGADYKNVSAGTYTKQVTIIVNP